MSRRLATCLAVAGALVLAAGAVGCSPPPETCPRVIFLDGAGWLLGDGPVRAGMKEANYPGEVERFGWSLGLGAPLDHAAAGPDLGKTAQLAERITRLREDNPHGQIALMGLSAGTTIIVYALEKLSADILVDDVVLLSSSISSRTDLREALSHVKDKMYVTVSQHDGVLSLGSSSGPESGEPAGLEGFSLPIDASGRDQKIYRKIEYIPWKKEYDALGWNGGHTSTVARKFIATVIAPKIMPGPDTVATVVAARPTEEQEPSKPPKEKPVKPTPAVEKSPAPESSAEEKAAAAAKEKLAKATGLIRSLGLGDDSTRKRAARDLKNYNVPLVVKALIEALRTDGYEDVRREAAVSLGEMLSRDAQPALRQAAREDRDSGVRKAALQSARKIESAEGIEP